MKYFRDGSMLHICRYYKPDYVYLYMSKEILEFHKKDNRFVKSIELLGKLLQHDFQVILIEKEDLVEVQDYDFFYHEFTEEISRIRKCMNQEDQLILNIASGTPAMKSALNIITTVAEFQFKAIQVSSPKKRGNLEYEERIEYDLETIWELNEDNQADSENRCKEVQCQNLILLLKKDIIKKHILAYDYVAALSVADEIKESLTPEAYARLQMAVMRVQLNRKAISSLQEEFAYDLYPVKSGDKQKTFEYALVLQLKLWKNELVDFVRGITPISIDLLYVISKTFCGVDIKDYTNTKNSVRKWSKEKILGTELQPILEKGFNGTFRYDVVYSSHIEKIISVLCKDKMVKEMVSKLVFVETKVRNVAAHEIVSVTDEWIYKRTNMRSAEIMEIIRYLCGRAGVVNSQECWDSYNQFNQDIIKLI